MSGTFNHTSMARLHQHRHEASASLVKLSHVECTSRGLCVALDAFGEGEREGVDIDVKLGVLVTLMQLYAKTGRFAESERLL